MPSLTSRHQKILSMKNIS